MSRDIDPIIEFVRDCDNIPVIHRQVIINRIEGDGAPDAEELDRARHQVESEVRPPPNFNADLHLCTQLTCPAPPDTLIRGIATVRGYLHRVAYCPLHAEMMGGAFRADSDV